MKRSRIVALIMVPALLTAFACGGCTRSAISGAMFSAWEHTGATDKPIVVDLAPSPVDEHGKVTPVPIAIDVESFNGDVVIITTNDLVNQARVKMIREATHGYGRDKEAKASLANVSCEAQLGTGDFGQVLKVKTTTTDPEPFYQRAHLRIEAPAVGDVTVRTSHGMVQALNIRGKVDISTNEGDVLVATPWAMTEPAVILNRGGDIDYRVRGESTGAFDLLALRGKVLMKVKNGQLRIFDRDSNRMLANLNDGRNLIELRTTEGDIRVAVTPNPLDVAPVLLEP
jgi:hypothetical protein